MATQWYYQLMGQELGPFSSAQLRQKALAGEIDPNTLVHTDMHQEWFLADQVPGLFAKPPGGPKAPAAAKAASMAPRGDEDISDRSGRATRAAPPGALLRSPINDKIPKKRQEDLEPGEEAYDFTYLDQEGSPAAASGADQWILVTSRKVAFDATLRKGEREYARSSGSIALEDIARVEHQTSQHRLGCSGRRYSLLRIMTRGETVELVVPLEEEAGHLQHSITDLIRSP
jgi:hypothetical protein